MTIVLLLPSRKYKSIGSSAAHFSFFLFLRHTLLLFVPICTGPFLPHVLLIYMKLWDPATMSFTLALCLTSAFVTVALHRLLHSPFNLPFTRLEHNIFLLMSDYVWAFQHPVLGPGMRKISGRISRFLDLSFSINPTLEIIASNFNTHFYFLSRVVLEWYQLSYTYVNSAIYSTFSPFTLTSVSALFAHNTSSVYN